MSEKIDVNQLAADAKKLETAVDEFEAKYGSDRNEILGYTAIDGMSERLDEALKVLKLYCVLCESTVQIENFRKNGCGPAEETK